MTHKKKTNKPRVQPKTQEPQQLISEVLKTTNSTNYGCLTIKRVDQLN